MPPALEGDRDARTHLRAPRRDEAARRAGAGGRVAGRFALSQPATGSHGSPDPRLPIPSTSVNTMKSRTAGRRQPVSESPGSAPPPRHSGRTDTPCRPPGNGTASRNTSRPRAVSGRPGAGRTSTWSKAGGFGHRGVGRNVGSASPAIASVRRAAVRNLARASSSRGTLKSPTVTAGSAGSIRASSPARWPSSARATRAYRFAGDQSPSRLADRWVLTTASGPAGVCRTASWAPLRITYSGRAGPVRGYRTKRAVRTGHRDSSTRPPSSSTPPDQAWWPYRPARVRTRSAWLRSSTSCRHTTS